MSKTKLVNFPVQHSRRICRMLNSVLLCRISYLDYSEAEKAFESLGCKNVNLIESSSTSAHDTQCYVVEKEVYEDGRTADRCFIVFRGTDLTPDKGGRWMTKLKDWKTNGDFRKVHYPGMVKGKVHAGFLWSFQDIRHKLFQDLRSRNIDFATHHGSIVAGHSLGGAVSTCAFPLLINEFSDVTIAASYTFGQPRVGDHEFTRRFNTNFERRFFRFVNNNDIVPAIPLMLMGFFHAGTKLYFNKDGVLYDNDDFWYVFFDRIFNEFQGVIGSIGDIIDFLGLTVIADHSIVEYEKKVKAIAQCLVDNNIPKN